MTDENRQKLLLDLNQPWTLCDDVDANLAALMARAAEEIERLAAIIHDYKLTFGDIHDVKWNRDAQSDAGPTQNVRAWECKPKTAEWGDRHTYLTYFRELSPSTECRPLALAQSDAEPALPQTLRDAAENLLIAIGMGWDIEGCVENLRAALAQSDAEPVRAFARAVLHGDDEHKAWLLEAAEAFCDGKPLPAPRGKGTALAQSDAEPVTLRTQFEGWAFTRGHRNFTKLREGYLLPEIQKDWLAFRAGFTAPPRPDAPAGLAREIWLNQANLQRPLSQEELERLIETYSRSGSDVSAGLIEAAEIVNDWANATSSLIEARLFDALARELRARAADRSGK